MSTYTRAHSRRQVRHAASRSESHQQDKRDGERRRETTWVPVTAPQRPSPVRSFGSLQGHEYTYDGQTWKRCHGPEEFADYLEDQSRRRNWYRDHTSRKGVPVTMTRRVAAPIEVVTTTFAPWLSEWTAATIAAGKDPGRKLAALRNRWVEAAQGLLLGQRYVLGYAFHADTDDLHFDLALSRQDGDGGRIGETGLKLTGPWMVGVDRQVRAGASIRSDKRRQLQRGIANFRRRYGEAEVPLDVALARALDSAAEEELGEELRPYREAYARSVPHMERQHAAAELAAVEATRKDLRSRALPPQEEDFPSIG